MGYADYKNRKRTVGSVLEKLKKSNSGKEKKSYADDRFYSWKSDEAGNGTVIMRFLPSNNDLPPAIKRYRHSFQHNGKYYIDNCATSIDGKCKVCEINSALHDLGRKSEATGRYRRAEYISNVLIIDDQLQPENNGKVFLYKYGQTIYDKILDIISDEDEPVDIFDLENGANFKLIIGKKAGYANYDKSKFMSQSSIGDDAKCEEVYNKIYSLTEFKDAKNFPTYEASIKKLNRVVGIDWVNEIDQKINGSSGKMNAEKPVKASTEDISTMAQKINDEEASDTNEEVVNISDDSEDISDSDLDNFFND